MYSLAFILAKKDHTYHSPAPPPPPQLYVYEKKWVNFSSKYKKYDTILQFSHISLFVILTLRRAQWLWNEGFEILRQNRCCKNDEDNVKRPTEVDKNWKKGDDLDIPLWRKNNNKTAPRIYFFYTTTDHNFSTMEIQWNMSKIMTK